MKITITKIIALVSISILITSCGTTAKFVYPANARNLIKFDDGPAYKKSIAVTPFDELRGDKNLSSTYFLYLIPLVPFGFGEYERPDAARMFNSVNEFDFDPSEDLAKAAAYSLRKSKLFNDAFFTFGGNKNTAQLLLEGEIISTTYNGSVWSYGLSVYGPMLWFIGLPSGTSENNLNLQLKLSDIKTKKTVWDKKYNLKHKVTQGLYYNYGHDVKGYSYLMQEIMNDAIEDIHRTLQKKTP